MIEYVSVVLLIPLLVAESTLFLLRVWVKTPRWYWACAGLYRGLTYSPCLLGLGHGAGIATLGFAVWSKVFHPEAMIVVFYGIPFVAVTICSSAISYGLTRRNAQDGSRTGDVDISDITKL